MAQSTFRSKVSKGLLFLSTLLSVGLSYGQTHTYPALDTINNFSNANTFPQINGTLYVGTAGVLYPTIQSAVTAACDAAPLKVNIPASFPITANDITSVTGGCTQVGVTDERVIPSLTYSWNGSVYSPIPSGGVTPSGIAGAIQVANSNGSALASDPHITIDTTTHVIQTSGGVTVNGVGLAGGLNFSPVTVCLGDSITNGIYLNRKDNVWCYRVASSWGGIPNDLGIPGITSGGIDQSTLFQNIPLTSPVVNTLIPLIEGTNNVGQAGANTNQEVNFGLDVAAQGYYIETQGTPYGLNPQTSSAIGYTGTWTNSTTFGGTGIDPGKVCTGLSCAFTVAFTGPTLELITGLTNSNAMAATITCDGTSTGVTPLFAGSGGSTLYQSQLAGFHVSLSNAAHSCVVQSTSSTGTLQFEWAAVPPGTTFASRTLLLGSVPGHYPDTNYAPYRPYQQSVATSLSNDGFQYVAYVDESAPYPIAASSFVDGATHPIDYNHYLMAKPMIAALNGLWGVNLVVPPPGPVGAENQGGGYPTIGNEMHNFGGDGLLNSISGASFDTACPGSGAANTTGSGNTFCGSNAGQSNTTGNYNTGFGTTNLYSNVTGYGYSSVGYNGFYAATGGGYGSGLGFGHCSSLITVTNVVCIGDYTGNTYGSGFAVTNSTHFTIVGSKSGLGVADASFTDWGVFGDVAYVSGSHSYEIGEGTNVTPGTLAFRGNSFLDGSANGTFNNVTINGTCTGCSTYSNTPFNGLTGGTNTTAAMVLGSGSSLSTSGTGNINVPSASGLTVASIPLGELVSTSLTAQSSAIGNTTVLYAVTTPGLYCVSYSLYMQAVGTSGNINVALGTSGSGTGYGGNLSINEPNISVTSLNSGNGGMWCGHVGSGGNVTYGVTFSSVVGSPQYGLDIAVRRVL